MSHLLSEIDDGPPTMICECGQQFTASSWEEVGRKFDRHAEELDSKCCGKGSYADN